MLQKLLLFPGSFFRYKNSKMRVCVFLSFLLATFTVALSAPTQTQHGFAPIPKISKPIYRPNDWLSDLIQLITGEDVAAFITLIHNTVRASENLGKDVLIELADVFSILEDGARGELEVIVTRAQQDVTDIYRTVVMDLATLMPAIASIRPHFLDVASLIQILLGKTLEQFLLQVGMTLLDTQVLIDITVEELVKVIDSVEHQAAVRIRAIADKTIVGITNLIQPILDVLEECVDLNSVSNRSPQETYFWLEGRDELRTPWNPDVRL